MKKHKVNKKCENVTVITIGNTEVRVLSQTFGTKSKDLVIDVSGPMATQLTVITSPKAIATDPVD